MNEHVSHLDGGLDSGEMSYTDETTTESPMEQGLDAEAYIGYLESRLSEEERENSRLKKEITALKKEKAELESAVGKDPLTGALNRRGYHDAIQEKYPSSGHTVMTFIDLDDFKSINDDEKYGYAVGDRIIAQTAHMIAAQMHSEDIILRYGGDEFIVVWNIKGEYTNQEIAEIIRRKEYELQVGLGTIGPLKKGASVGSAVIELPEVKDLTVSKGTDEEDAGGILFQRSRDLMREDKIKRKSSV
ncbi:GGDEF domain-containing protein [Candidatus Saccharibacteria bacterium]|nr:GGDEF domain-containing protein [Candidatus Saccharibacteria bacterium]